MSAPRVAYRMVLPPGWLLLPVRDRSDDELRRLIVDQYADLPRDSAGPLISRLADAVVAGLGDAREADVVDVVLPLGAPWSSAVSASIALAVAAGDPSDEDADGDTGEEIDTDAGPASRVVTERPRSALRRVEYTWTIPSVERALLIATFSIVGDADPQVQPLVDALTELCDAILSTLRWERDGAADPEPAEETA